MSQNASLLLEASYSIPDVCSKNILQRNEYETDTAEKHEKIHTEAMYKLGNLNIQKTNQTEFTQLPSHNPSSHLPMSMSIGSNALPYWGFKLWLFLLIEFKMISKCNSFVHSK